MIKDVMEKLEDAYEIFMRIKTKVNDLELQVPLKKEEEAHGQE